jgi:hypothetical protein
MLAGVKYYPVCRQNHAVLRMLVVLVELLLVYVQILQPVGEQSF